MTAPAPTITAGQRCLIRIAATVVHEHESHGFTIDYMGVRFLTPASTFRGWIDGSHMAVFELVSVVQYSTGLASYIVSYQSHALRVHVQQIRLLEEVSCD